MTGDIVAEAIEKKRKNTARMFRIIGVSFVIIVFTILAIIKFNNPDSKMGIFFIIGGSVLLVGLMGIFSKTIMEAFRGKIKKENELRQLPVKTIEEVKAFLREEIKSPEYADMIPWTNKHRIHTIGQNPASSIFELRSRGIIKNLPYVLLASMHYPKNKFSILINPPQEDVNKAINSLAEKKEIQPDVKKTTSVNPLLGTEVTTEEITSPKQEKKEDKDGGLKGK